MGALTRTNAIHAPHLLARSYEKGWPRQPLWNMQQRAIIHQAAQQRGVAEVEVRPASCQLPVFESVTILHGPLIWVLKKINYYQVRGGKLTRRRSLTPHLRSRIPSHIADSV